MRCRTFAATDIGRVRDHNEDAHAIDAELGLQVVADGMGGHPFGEVASAVASARVRERVAERADVVRAFHEGRPEADANSVREVLYAAMRSACRAVWRRAEAEPEKRGMGTTCSAVLVAGDRAFVAHVGDSRVYVVRDGRAVQLTRDHTVLNEMIESGELLAAATARAGGYGGALVRALGTCEDVEVDVFDVETVPGDAFVLCSDGLTRHLRADEIGPLVAENPADAAGRLIALANERGGLDNITVVVASVEGAEGPSEDERSRELATKIAVFRRIPLFRHLTAGPLYRVLARTDARTFPAGEVVLREGEPGDAMYVVLSGQVRIEKWGDPVVVLSPGAHFGELALLDGAPRSATAVVVEDARLLRLHRDHLDELIERAPEIAAKILLSFACTLAERLRATTEAARAARAAGAAGCALTESIA